LQIGIDWDWYDRQYPATRARFIEQDMREKCWSCGWYVDAAGKPLPLIEPAHGEVIEVDSRADVRSFVLTDKPVRIEHRCDCDAIEVVVDRSPNTFGTIRYLHSPCTPCQRAHALALNGSPDCPICAEPTTFKPDHMGSPGCRSGSLASGGTQAHCTCDTCF